MNNPSLHVVILAAGAGTRMRSQTPKVLHPLMGKPMLQHVIDAAKQLNPHTIWLIYGHEGDKIKTAINDPALRWIEQSQRLGTGHALITAYPELMASLQPTDGVLIISADSPALSAETLRSMLTTFDHCALCLLNIIVDNPTGFGRVLRDPQNNITAIIEEKDTDQTTRIIKEIYSGIMLVRFDILTQYLPQLTTHNAQKEYYLTQLISLCYMHQEPIDYLLTQDAFEARGVNDRAQLAELERYMHMSAAHKLMGQGISIVDPARFDLRGTLSAAPDVRIDLNCIIEGTVSIGAHTSIGAHCILKNCQIGEHVTIQPYTMLDGAIIGDHAIVGPFARIRPDTILEEASHVGNFVEVKKTRLGKNSKANHLSYLGDAQIGANVNIGAGTITCNYDGVHKHQTNIGDQAFIGSNTALVAPINIASGATIGAGSTITKDAPQDQLTVARGKQISIPGWKRSKE